MFTFRMAIRRFIQKLFEGVNYQVVGIFYLMIHEISIASRSNDEFNYYRLLRGRLESNLVFTFSLS